MLTIEAIYAKLQSDFNVSKDELDDMGVKEEEQVREFYSTYARQAKDLDTTDENDKSVEVEDNYTLSADQKRELAIENKDNERRAEAKTLPLADMTHLPKEEQVTQEDIAKEMQLLKKARIVRPKASE